MALLWQRLFYTPQGQPWESDLLTEAVSALTSALANDWKGNYWDDYEGFERDADGIGDTPQNVYLYSDPIWTERPMTRFFRASPAFESIDFVERLAPFQL